VEKRVEELIERGVAALEKLANEEIEFQVETKPPVCPHCGTINPNIRVEEATGSGPMAEHFTQAHCLHCHKVFYIIALQYECLKTNMDARAVIEEKVQLGGYQRNGKDN
jgi:ribosomal protein S27AE